jgi:hypothetical protein
MMGGYRRRSLGWRWIDIPIAIKGALKCYASDVTGQSPWGETNIPPEQEAIGDEEGAKEAYAGCSASESRCKEKSRVGSRASKQRKGPQIHG